MAPTLDDEVAFISGVNSDGTLPLHAYAAWNTGTIPADYSGGYTLSEKWGAPTAGTPGGTVSYFFSPSSNWSLAEQSFLAAGLSLWSSIANISFTLAASPAQAQLTFKRGDDGKAYTSTQASVSPGAELTGGSILGTTVSALISIDTSVTSFNMTGANFTAVGGYPVMTFLHEEGHALGLGHAGPYNGSANPATQQFSAYDTRLWSIMSYLEPRTSSAAYFSDYPVTGTNWGFNANGYRNEPTTWMPLDILAAQALYGLPVSTPLSGGQVFGFNSNIQGPVGQFFDFTKNVNPIVTLWSLGGNNTLDLSGFSAPSTINLNPGTFSSADGMANNIAIAFNTAIDSFIGGSGSDSVMANSNGNTFRGNGGNDFFAGGNGIDTAIYSGLRSDYAIDYGAGMFTIRDLRPNSPDGTDRVSQVEFLLFADQQLALTIFGAPSQHTPSDLNADGHSDILWRNDDGHVGVWLMDGTTILSDPIVGGNPGPSWRVAGTGDFNGDGKADFLWQHSSGQAGIWLMDGSAILADPAVGSSPGSDWKIIGAGDFDGDGKSDLLWQNSTGQAAIWLLNGATVLSQVNVGANPGPSWRIIGTGDLDNDGKSDIVWQHESGQAGVWLMNGTAVRANPSLGGSPDPSWKIVGTGDFDGNGKDDFVWQNTDGRAAVWMMDGASILSQVNVGANPGSAWQIKGTGDLDGDGKADMLWQNTNGQAGAWLMNGTTILSSPSLGSNSGPAWHVVAVTGG